MALTAESWSRAAFVHDTEIVHVTVPHARQALALALPLLPETARILDVAAGTGALTFAAAELGHAVTAIDYAEGMCEWVREKAHRLGFGDRVTAQCIDAAQLTVDEASFDAAFVTFALSLVPNADAVVQQMARAVKPGGLVVITQYMPDQFHTVYFNCIAHNTGRDTAPMEAMLRRMSSAPQLNAALENASLAPVATTQHVSTTRPYINARDYVASLAASAHSAPLSKEQETARDAARLAYVEKSFGPTSQFSLHVQSITAVGRKAAS